MLRRELDIERDVNSELKRLLVNALISEDMNCKLSSLAEDKIRLAKNIDTYYNRLRDDTENRERLSVENTLWKSKFMAMAIRADDIRFNLNVTLKLFKKGEIILLDYMIFLAQTVISELSRNVNSKTGELGNTICELLNIDVLSLYNKTPCDEWSEKHSHTSSSLTVSCCGRCSGKEIKLV
jgi:hypothetical protein